MTAVPKDGGNEISYLKKRVIVVPSGASAKARLQHPCESSGSLLPLRCQNVSSG